MSTIASTLSKNKKTIKLTTERWLHITESHDYMAGYFHNVLETINDPAYVVAGKKEELLAIKFYKKTHISHKYLICCYREKNKKGFVITAFMTSKIDSILKRRKILWRRQ
jgi:hypothetical protein